MRHVPVVLVAILLGSLGVSGEARAAELVMFEEAGCSWCRRWDSEIGHVYPRSHEGRRAPLRRLHISRARTSGLRLSAPVTVTPTFVLIDGDAEIGRITGYPGEDFFWGLLGALIARLPAERAPPPEAAREAALSATPDRPT